MQCVTQQRTPTQQFMYNEYLVKSLNQHQMIQSLKTTYLWITRLITWQFNYNPFRLNPRLSLNDNFRRILCPKGSHFNYN